MILAWFSGGRDGVGVTPSRSDAWLQMVRTIRSARPPRILFRRLRTPHCRDPTLLRSLHCSSQDTDRERSKAILLGGGAAAILAAAWYSYHVKQAETPAPLAPVDVAIVTGGSGPYWQIAVKGAQAAAKEFNVNLRVESPPDAENLPEQTEILEKLAASDVRGVALSPVDAEGQTKLIDQMAGSEYSSHVRFRCAKLAAQRLRGDEQLRRRPGRRSADRRGAAGGRESRRPGGQ
jgi:hypothetical protein